VAARWIGLPIRQAQHFLLSTASLSVLGYEHNLAEEPAIVLWNAVSNGIFNLMPHQRVGDQETATKDNGE
jgi:hypothetical protein